MIYAALCDVSVKEIFISRDDASVRNSEVLKCRCATISRTIVAQEREQCPSGGAERDSIANTREAKERHTAEQGGGRRRRRRTRGGSG